MSEPRQPLNWFLAVGIVAAAVLLVAVAVWRLSGDDPTVTPPPPSPTDEPTDPPSPTETDSADNGETEGRAPTDQDAEAYAQRGDTLGLTVDVTGDGWLEVVFASVVARAARIEIAAWDGQAYQTVFVGSGGGADRLDLVVSDYTEDGTPEIVTLQSVGSDGESLSIWGHDGSAFSPMRAVGGCWDGSHTFGVVGATIGEGRISATCDGSPLPTSAWPSDVYVWDGDAWSYDATQEPGGREASS